MYTSHIRNIFIWGAVMLAASVTIFTVGLQADLTAYRDIGQGARPSEYPPLITAIFTVIANIPRLSFLESWTLFYGSIIAAAIAYEWYLKEKNWAWHLPLTLLMLAIILGPNFTFLRFDFLVGILLYLTWRAYIAGKFSQSAALITIAALVKIIPALLWPILWIHVPPRHRRAIVLATLTTCLGVAAVSIGILGPQKIQENITHLMAYHSTRGIDLASTWSTAHMLLQKTSGTKATIQFHHGAMHNDDLKSFAPIAKWIMAVVLAVAIMLITAWGKRTQSTLIWQMLIVLILFLLTTPVFSPQYLVWLLPLIFSWWLKLPLKEQFTRKTVPIIAATLAVSLLTQVTYPYAHLAIVRQEGVGLWILSLRQLVLICLGVLVCIQKFPLHAITPTVNLESHAKTYAFLPRSRRES